VGIGEIIKEVWELPHWWDVLVVAVVDDALLLARIFTGFFSWWPPMALNSHCNSYLRVNAQRLRRSKYELFFLQ